MIRSRLTVEIALLIVLVLIIGFGASRPWARRP